MSGPAKPHRLQSWVPPSFTWTTAAHVFGVNVPISDPDVIKFVATGTHRVHLHRSRAKARLVAALLGPDSLRGQLEVAAWSLLRHTAEWQAHLAMANVYCHGAFSVAGDKELFVLAGAVAPTNPSSWLSEEVRGHAARYWNDHQAEVAAFEELLNREKEVSEDFYRRHPEAARYRGSEDAEFAIKAQRLRPVITADCLLPYLAKAAMFRVSAPCRPRSVTRAATQAIVESGWAMPRDGIFTGLLDIPTVYQRLGVVSWEPNGGLPSYPEVRWAVQQRLPSALRRPRITEIARPKFDTSTQSVHETVGITEIALEANDGIDALEDLQLDQSDFRDRVEEIRRDTRSYGFEAIAWFQPYHSWTEATWGVYFDSRKLDDLALSFLDDFKSQRIRGSHSDAARIAFGLTYAHEMFHARVEAALSWLEVNVLQPRHLRYKQRVYDALRETPDWLEEALANWSAWDWFRSEPIQVSFSRRMPTLDDLQRIVESSLDLSPPGYRDWRVGHQAATWRTFATQLSTGSPKPTSPAIGLPLESTLKGPLPYDLRAADVPLRFVGRGVIADRLQSHPATFNVPTRRELEKALKHFKHVVDPSGGKGAHQKWTGPDHRAFILPTRDPVSVGVFKTFLQHVGIDKAAYVRDVRPNL